MGEILISIHDMTVHHLAECIRHENSNTNSTLGQLRLARVMYREGLLSPEKEGMSRADLDDLVGDFLDSKTGTCLGNLRDITLVDRWTEGPDHFIIHDRRDEIVNGGDLEQLIGDEVQRLTDDLQSSTDEDSGTAVADGGPREQRLREALAEEFDTDPEDVEEELHHDEIWDERDALEDAVDAIERTDGVSKGNYDKIRVIRNPYDYALSERAINIIEKPA